MESRSEHIAENSAQATLSETSKPIKPEGEVLTPALICGAVGAVLTITLSLIGRYASLDLTLQEYYMAAPFYMPEPNPEGWHPLWDWVLVIALSFGVSFAVLDTDKKWRRLMIILMFSVVIIFASPVLMLWDVFWSPITVFIGVLWSWICAFIYSCQHTMPCEILLSPSLEIHKQAEANATLPQEEEEIVEKKYEPKDHSSCLD